MPKVFEFTLQGDVSAKLEQIKRAAAAKRVSFQGDIRKGSFHGGVSIPLLGIKEVIDGSYTITGDRIRVTVREKPSSYSWEKVESELRGFIEG